MPAHNGSREPRGPMLYLIGREIPQDGALGPSRVDLTSCAYFLANQLHVLLTAAAYVLMQELPMRAARTKLARAQVSTLCDAPLKIGDRVSAAVRRIVLAHARDLPLRIRPGVSPTPPTKPQDSPRPASAPSDRASAPSRVDLRLSKRDNSSTVGCLVNNPGWAGHGSSFRGASHGSGRPTTTRFGWLRRP